MKTNTHFPIRAISTIPISSQNVKYKQLLKKWQGRDTFNHVSTIALPEDISTWGEFPILIKPNLNDIKETKEEAELGETNY
ncbi:MAG: hypothetical protein KA797_07225 [Chitinophagales bacterium]|nr:hypothetical protein [Chitinophagales bacterium]